MYTSSVKFTRVTASLHNTCLADSLTWLKRKKWGKNKKKKFKGQRRPPGFSLEQGKRMLKGTYQK